MINKSEMNPKMVLKEGYLIPVSEPSDSMLNYDQLESKYIDKTLTLPLKNESVSRFEPYFKTKTLMLIKDLDSRRKKKTRTAVTQKTLNLDCDSSKLKNDSKSEGDLFNPLSDLVKDMNNLAMDNQQDEDNNKSELERTSETITKAIGLEVIMEEKEIFEEKKPLSSSYLGILNDIDNYPTFSMYVQTVSQKRKEEIGEMIVDNFISIISKSSGAAFLIDIYHIFKQIHIQSNLLFKCDYLIPSKSQSHAQLIVFINYIYSISREDADIVYSRFNDENTWAILCRHKYGKNVVENFLNTFYKDEAFKHLILVDYLIHNFLDLSQANYTTFVVQAYISNFKDQRILGLIKTFFDELCSTRNGVFLMITSLKTYTNCVMLLDIILAKSELLCKGLYTSTLMEFVFKAFTTYTAPKFIRSKRSFIQGKHEYFI